MPAHELHQSSARREKHNALFPEEVKLFLIFKKVRKKYYSTSARLEQNRPIASPHDLHARTAFQPPAQPDSPPSEFRPATAKIP